MTKANEQKVSDFLKDHFSKIDLPAHLATQWEKELVNHSYSEKERGLNLKSKTSLFSFFTFPRFFWSGWAAAGVIGFVVFRSGPPSFLEVAPEMFTHTDFENYPTDFHLEGDWKNLNQLVSDDPSSDAAPFDVPKHPNWIDQYQPDIGRFVNLRGLHGVAVRLLDEEEENAGILYVIDTPIHQKVFRLNSDDPGSGELLIHNQSHKAHVWKQGNKTFVWTQPLD